MGRLLKPPSALLRSITRILRPLARLMIANGIPLPAAVEMLKESYVRVAESEFRIEEDPPTDTRVSLLTGVHRKDVKRLRAADGAKEASVTELNVLSEVVTRWISDRRYMGRDGKPRPLARSARAGVAHTFASLAYGISSDLKPRPVLDELLRLGMVSVDAQDRVRLEVGAFVPAKAGEEKAFYFGENAGDHLAAGVHNLMGQEPPYLDQAVYSDDLSPDSISTLLNLSREQWAGMLRVLVTKTAELEARDKSAGRATERLNVGMYFYSEPREAPKDDAS